MKLLLDTNIFLELLLSQADAASVIKLFQAKSKYDFYMTDYSLHSIGLILFRRKLYPVFEQFVKTMLDEVGTTVLSLPREHYTDASMAAQRYTLDFDDAYQFTVANTSDLTIVSFDSDFDRTPRGRKTPNDIIASASTTASN